MTTNTPRRSPWLKAALAALLLALVAAACGGDDSETSSSSGDGSATTEDPGTPVAGGSATVLQLSEIGTLDPVKMTGTSGSDGQRAFALYGALVTYQSETDTVEPLLAESIEPSADFSTWTLKLKPGVTFSDGSAYDADAVKFNWERAKDPANRSPSLTVASTIAALDVVDPTTLTITLSTPNAHFDNAVGRFPINYIASPTAIQGGTDLTSAAVGAGPYLLDSWLRDDRMILKKNTAWKGGEGPYLDEIVVRVIGDESQRVDTFTTGQADAFITTTAASVARAKAERSGSQYPSVVIPTGQTYAFNTSKPPFDDLRVRKAFVMAVDWQAMVETVFGEGSEAPTNFTLEDTPWYTPDANLPEFDPAAAQELIDEYVAETGQPIKVTALAFQQNIDQARAKFIQTAISQLDDIELEVQVNDSPTNIGKVLAGDYSVSSWGFPTMAPDPGLVNAALSQSRSNYTKYANPDVDAALLEARVIEDPAQQAELYSKVYRQLAADLPFYPYLIVRSGFVTAPELHGTQLYEDGILRFDLLWKSA